MRADCGETSPELYADLSALNPAGGSETAILEQHQGGLGTPYVPVEPVVGQRC